MVENSAFEIALVLSEKIKEGTVMKKRAKKQEVAMEEVQQAPYVMEPVAPATPVMPVETAVEQKALVNCPKCGAGLYVDSTEVVYMCPVCNSLMRVRIGERIVKNVR